MRREIWGETGAPRVGGWFLQFWAEPAPWSGASAGTQSQTEAVCMHAAGPGAPWHKAGMIMTVTAHLWVIYKACLPPPSDLILIKKQKAKNLRWHIFYPHIKDWKIEDQEGKLESGLPHWNKEMRQERGRRPWGWNPGLESQVGEWGRNRGRAGP